MRIRLEVRFTDAGLQFRARCAAVLPDGDECGGELQYGYRPDIRCLSASDESWDHGVWSAPEWWLLGIIEER